MYLICILQDIDFNEITDFQRLIKTSYILHRQVILPGTLSPMMSR